jgi:predicted metal-dependent phosphoesterase TrpH
MTSARSWLRADLHVHSYHSGYASHLRWLRTRDCYSDPDDVYRTAKACGMDLVTLTDHDSIDGCLEFLSRHPGAEDFFISEEIECWFPDTALRIHIGAYDIDESIHREIQRLRTNVYDVAAFLRQHEVTFALHHLLFFYQDQLPLEDYVNALWPLFPAIEVRNGTMLPDHNRFVDEVRAEYAMRPGGLRTAIGGSDSHTLSGVGSTYTEAEGRTRRDFLDSLRAGRTRAGGRHGSALRVAQQIYGVIWQYWRTLLGLGRQDLSPSRRALGLAWSMATLPVDFLPLLIAISNKSGEARRTTACRRHWRSRAGAADRVVTTDQPSVDRRHLAASADKS